MHSIEQPIGKVVIDSARSERVPGVETLFSHAQGRGARRRLRPGHHAAWVRRRGTRPD